jgi:hypothetical protein
MPSEQEITLRNLHNRLTRLEEAVLELDKAVNTLTEGVKKNEEGKTNKVVSKSDF